MADRPRRTGPPDKTTGSNTRTPMKTVTIYTDGACSGNPGPGGWGSHSGVERYREGVSGGEPETTNNRMELTAVIRSLALLKEPCIVELYSDPSTSLTHWRKAGSGAGRSGAG